MAHRPLVLCLLAFPLLLPAAAGAESDALSLAGQGPVVIAPLNLGIQATDELEPGLQPVWREILRHFSTLEQRPRSIERHSAQVLWESVLSESPDDGDVYGAYARFARRLAEEVEFDALVMPSLVPRVAKIRGHRASWDGVFQPVELPSEVADGTERVIADGLQVARNGVRGEIEAASLHVVVLGPDGALRFEGVGGLTLLQRVVRDDKGELLAAARTESFGDPEPLREGVAVAFERQLPAAIAR